MLEQKITRRLLLKRAAAAAGVLAFLPIPAIARIGSGEKGEKYFEHTVIGMGTTVRLGLYAPTEAEAARVANRVFDKVRELESLLSYFNPASDVSRINNAAGHAATPVNPLTFEVIARSIDAANSSSHAFDITVAPLLKLWGFREGKRPAAPSQAEIEALLPVVGSQNIALDPSTQTVMLSKRGAAIDLGGVAVGFTLDRVREILEDETVRHAFFDISGDVLALGSSNGLADNSGWSVGIPDPRNLKQIVHSFTLHNECLATSGNYMNYVVYQAKHYGHIIDPQLGRSAHKLQSATAVGKSGLYVDAYSTGAFVLGASIGEDLRYYLV